MKKKKLKGISTVKYLVVIQLEWYMHLIDPIALLWATVSKGTTGLATFFSESHTQDFAINSDLKLAHHQCSSKEIAHVPKSSKRNTHCPMMYGYTLSNDVWKW